MKKNTLLKFFAAAVMIFMLIVPAYAASGLNNLMQIIVENTDNNSYKLNLIFDSKYQGNAFIQQKGASDYYIFLPDTVANTKKTKVIYKKRQDKSNLNISIEEKPFITENNNSKYVRLTVNAKDNYSLKVVSSTLKETQNGFLVFLGRLFKTVGMLLFIAGVLYVAKHIVLNSSSKPSYDKNNYKYRRNKRTSSEKPVSIPSAGVRRTLKTVADDSFTCFDITGEGNNNKSNYYDFKRALNNKATLAYDSKIKSKTAHTNPINEASELELPVIEDSIEHEKKKDKKPEAELISVLNITPRIGFYLTNVGETLALFGFVGENVFLFKKFSDLSQINLQARFYDKHGENDLYIVKLDTYKAMIEISKTGMKELAVL